MANWVTLANGVHIDLDDPTNPITGSGSFSDLGKDKIEHNPYKPASSVFDKEKYPKTYENKYLGTISKYTASVVYKAMKNGDIDVLKETTSFLYNESDDKSPLSVKIQKYNNNRLEYDMIDNLTTALMNDDFNTAQRLINQIEYFKIKNSGSKSPYYKYRDKISKDD